MPEKRKESKFPGREWVWWRCRLVTLSRFLGFSVSPIRRSKARVFYGDPSAPALSNVTLRVPKATRNATAPTSAFGTYSLMPEKRKESKFPGREWVWWRCRLVTLSRFLGFSVSPYFGKPNLKPPSPIRRSKTRVFYGDPSAPALSNVTLRVPKATRNVTTAPTSAFGTYSLRTTRRRTISKGGNPYNWLVCLIKYFNTEAAVC